MRQLILAQKLKQLKGFSSHWNITVDMSYTILRVAANLWNMIFTSSLIGDNSDNEQCNCRH